MRTPDKQESRLIELEEFEFIAKTLAILVKPAIDLVQQLIIASQQEFKGKIGGIVKNK